MSKKKNNRTYIWLIILLLLFSFIYINKKQNKLNEISYNKFIEKIEEKEITEIEVDLTDGKFIIGYDSNGNTYKTDSPKYENFKHDMLKYGVKVTEVNEFNIQQLVKSIFSILPIVFMGTLVYTALNQFNFKGIDKSFLTTDNQSVTFDDVAGLKPVKKDMELLVEFLKNPDKFKEKGAILPKGVIFYGEPGTGKTLMAKAIAGEANVPFFSLNGSDFIEMFAGVGAKRVRSLFEEARKNSPCIIFIDEIDSIGGKRVSDTGNNEQRQTINALLSEMDGFNNSEGILVICATNRLSDLDNALIRPGRFDKHIRIPLPETKEERLQIVNLYTKDKSFSDDVDFKQLAKETIGFSPAEIKSLINEATLISIQDNKDLIDRESIDKAVYKILLKGHMKDSDDRNQDEQTIIAWHEAGHAVVGKLCGMDISKVTIVPSTSGAGGVNFITPKKLGLFSSKEIEDNIKLNYAGRVAELLLLSDPNKVTTGATNDIQKATDEIYNMVTTYGMSEKYGLLNLNQLNIDNKEVLNEVISISKRLEQETLSLLTKHKDLLESVANLLLEKETISGEDLDLVFEKFFQ